MDQRKVVSIMTPGHVSDSHLICCLGSHVHTICHVTHSGPVEVNNISSTSYLATIVALCSVEYVLDIVSHHLW